jgi:hypothetical protein
MLQRVVVTITNPRIASSHFMMNLKLQPLKEPGNTIFQFNLMGFRISLFMDDDVDDKKLRMMYHVDDDDDKMTMMMYDDNAGFNAAASQTGTLRGGPEYQPEIPCSDDDPCSKEISTKLIHFTVLCRSSCSNG